MASKQFVATIINVSQPIFTKTAKGGYNKIDVTYKDGEGKTGGKPIVDFDTKEVPTQAEIYKYCRTLKEGDKVSVTMEKGEKYWQWTAVTPATGESQGSPEATGSNPSESGSDSGNGTSSPKIGAARGRVTGSNYETPKERAARQVYIARQSSLERALDLVIHNAQNGQIAPEAVIEVAKVFEAYVQGPVSKFADMQDDIPF